MLSSLLCVRFSNRTILYGCTYTTNPEKNRRGGNAAVKERNVVLKKKKYLYSALISAYVDRLNGFCFLITKSSQMAIHDHI